MLAAQDEQHREPWRVESRGAPPFSVPGSLMRPAHSWLDCCRRRCWRRVARRSGIPSCGHPRAPLATTSSTRRAAPGRRVSQQTECQLVPDHVVAVGERRVDVATPGPPSCLVPLQSFPGHLRIDIDERLALGQGHDAGERSVGGDGDGRGSAWLDGYRGGSAQCHRYGRPGADQGPTSVLGSRCSAPLSEPRVEVD